MQFPRDMVDEKHPLKAVALLLRRAGLEHLVTDPSPEELQALADAGDELAMERVAYFIKSLGDPGEALQRFDNGAMRRAETKRLACLHSRAR